MKKPIIYRKRYIPSEIIDITGDELVARDATLIVTKWKPIKKRSDISGGISYTFLEKGYKISKFFDSNGDFKYWYCDIIDVEYDDKEDKYILVDLILDVRITLQGQIEVLDADELAEALEREIITKNEAVRSLRILDGILKLAYEGKFPPEICNKY